MQLALAQKKIVENKHLGYSIVKGDKYSGKTTTAVYRSLYLKNNYCLYDNDKILILSKNTDFDYINQMYTRAENETKLEYMTLFSYEEHKLSIETMDNIIYRYFLDYKNKFNGNIDLIDAEEQKCIIINQCIAEIQEQYKNIKILNIKYAKFIIDEISWMKSCKYLKIGEYQNADRIGRKIEKGHGSVRIAKNSRTREAIFRVMLLYNKKLKDKNLIDNEDMTLLALERAKAERNKFNHIIVDDCQNLTKAQVEFIDAICNKNSYWSTMFISNYNLENSNGWIIKGRKLKALELGDKVRNYYLKESYEARNRNYDEEKYVLESIKANNNCTISSLENYEYYDIRHKKKHDFTRDANFISEVIVKNGDKEEEYTEEELKGIDVYSNIAAGEPILINPDIEDTFYIPKYWLKGLKDCFILKVNGDSMINADICNGDYVVIHKQCMAENNNIVAVNLDGSATLKRLKIGKNEVLLMPENKKYNPIKITEEGATIMGVAVGVIKHK